MWLESLHGLASRFFDNTAETYDKIVTWTTFGKDGFWKKEILCQISTGESFLDLGCGTGILTRKIAQKFPYSSIFGIDLSKSYLEIAKMNSTAYKNITFFHQDAEKIDLGIKFDCIVSSYIPKYCNPSALIQKCIKHLNHDGKIILHDFIYPKNNSKKILWNLYFVLLKLVGNFIPEWKYAFSELPKLIKTSDWLYRYKKELTFYGFDVKIIYLTWSCAAVIIATRI